jgi:hypothetical protein
MPNGICVSLRPYRASQIYCLILNVSRKENRKIYQQNVFFKLVPLPCEQPNVSNGTLWTLWCWTFRFYCQRDAFRFPRIQFYSSQYSVCIFSKLTGQVATEIFYSIFRIGPRPLRTYETQNCEISEIVAPAFSGRSLFHFESVWYTEKKQRKRERNVAWKWGPDTWREDRQ